MLLAWWHRQQDAAPGRSILLASEGRDFSPAAIALATQMALESGRSVRVVTIARLWGSALGLPNPGLKPTRAEMAAQEENVSRAIAGVEKAGISAGGIIITTRAPCRAILKEAQRCNCAAIVMAADQRRFWLLRSLLWSQEPYRVKARARIPVHLLVD